MSRSCREGGPLQGVDPAGWVDDPTAVPPPEIGGDRTAPAGRERQFKTFALQSWLRQTWSGFPLRRLILICGTLLCAGLPTRVIANGCLKLVVLPMTMGKYSGAVDGESVTSRMKTVDPGVSHGCKVRPEFWWGFPGRPEQRPVGTPLGAYSSWTASKGP